MLVRILIVDDSEVTGKLLSSLLTEKGFQVKVLTEGAGVVNEAMKFNPNLILMDLLLADIDGADAVKLLLKHRRTADIPILFLSAILEKNDQQSNTISVNEREFPALSKSITSMELLNSINKALKKNR